MTGTIAPAPPDDAGARTRRTLVVLFVGYLALLAWVVLWKLEVPWAGPGVRRVVKLVPFVATDDAGASAPAEVVTNAVLFVPFGLYLGLLAPAWRWWRVAGVVAAASVGLEVSQYVLAVGSTDVTDVLVNTAGGLAGLALLGPVRRRLGVRTRAVMARVCVTGTVLALVATAVVVASPVRYAPPGDGGLHHRMPLQPPGGELRP